MYIVVVQLDLKPVGIKRSSLRTMAKHVRRTMLPGNHEVCKKLFAEVQWICPSSYLVNVPWITWHHVACSFGWKSNPRFCSVKRWMNITWFTEALALPIRQRYPLALPMCFCVGTSYFAWYCVVCWYFTPDLRICCYWRWIQVLRLCTCVDVGNLRRSWEW